LYNDGSHYHGDVVRGVKQGHGKLSQPVTLNLSVDDSTDGSDVNIVYEGEFDFGMKHGPGKLFIENGSFSLESKFICDKPIHEANQFLLKLPKPPQTEEAVIDPKAKKPDPKAAAQAKPEEDPNQNKNKLVYEIGKENNTIEFEIHVAYQGPPYEDPNPPVVEEKQAAPAKGGKGPAK
jgi:MORN repeat